MPRASHFSSIVNTRSTGDIVQDLHLARRPRGAVTASRFSRITEAEVDARIVLR
ncbi:MAG: hypothetical protein U0Q18_11280 [Bryobacteraceae bacterium]